MSPFKTEKELRLALLYFAGKTQGAGNKAFKVGLGEEEGAPVITSWPDNMGEQPSYEELFKFLPQGK